ncbi:hypothetical protein M514_13747 [Trichuris suis]|uniref:Uncharacterized protein n=1 Tax=Trichuris suis TaxID=68888 RepID=A0A085N3U8_9BILA|nr:hypothetical protein M513_13747 [Trichuris suis]KFD64144.1 hypothetical protein M514_13747 [Trichuris suis]
MPWRTEMSQADVTGGQLEDMLASTVNQVNNQRLNLLGGYNNEVTPVSSKIDNCCFDSDHARSKMRHAPRCCATTEQLSRSPRLADRLVWPSYTTNIVQAEERQREAQRAQLQCAKLSRGISASGTGNELFSYLTYPLLVTKVIYPTAIVFCSSTPSHHSFDFSKKKKKWRPPVQA